MSVRCRVAVITGSRAEYGLLRPVMQAIESHENLELCVVVTGSHLLDPDRTIEEVREKFSVDATVPMQESGTVGRHADAIALGRGITGMASEFAGLKPDVVLVLGDRIEAFAAAAAGAVAGIHVAHVHGGDRAEGVADESMRHAITKLAHLHLPATEQSAHRIVAMGEDPARVYVVGSPAADGLADMPPLDDTTFDALDRPSILFLFHPVGRDDEAEHHDAKSLLGACTDLAPTLALHPNHDPGRTGIVRAIESAACPSRTHLPRDQFVGLLRRVDLVVGNSSAGLIEAAIIGRPAVNVGPRQGGREAPPNVLHIATPHESDLVETIRRGLSLEITRADHPYGDGAAGRHIADQLVALEPQTHPLAKQNTY